ncbi:MAG: hypothetical protein PUC29_05160 [Clostridia bacterium]|nr:hypothetical protein [Clostridia bacterium]
MKTTVLVDNLKIPVSGNDGDALAAAERILKKHRIPYEKSTLRLRKKSVDARKKDSIAFVCSVCAESGEAAEKLPKVSGVRYFAEEESAVKRGHEKMDGRPYIVGFGPAGMFCALVLARNGMRPVVIERGGSIAERTAAVESFYKTGRLDIDTNIQFGAGGAGTFSDGKLVTRIGDRRTAYVLEALNRLGAPDDIMWRAKPHVGTDVLRCVVENAAREIERLGGEIRYKTKVEKIKDRQVMINGEWESCGCAVLAPGHSARDLYERLLADGFAIEAKPFSVGVRIEHLQRELDRAMYGDEAIWEKLGHAEYALSHREGDRGVYTFCMCPGGEVVAAASEEGGVVTNGMSCHARDGKNANAAVAVSVLPSDFGNDPKAAVEFQRTLERAAFRAGGGNYFAPCQSVGNFYLGKEGGFNERIAPTYMNSKVRAADLGKILPPFVTSMLKTGFAAFGRKIKGFDTPDAPLTGIETRTSAPLRILRDERLCAVGYELVYPCGEGAGYAGGITSAAVDGIRVAEAILERFSDDC